MMEDADEDRRRSGEEREKGGKRNELHAATDSCHGDTLPSLQHRC